MAEVGDVFLSFVEGGPAIRIHRFPLLGAKRRGAVANPSRREVQPGSCIRRLLDLEVCLVQEQMSPKHAVTELGADGGIQPALKA
eukprot:s822_g23.t1